MTNTEIELRVSHLEKELASLKTRVEQNVAPVPWWEKIAGTFAHDDAHEEAMRLGRAYRLAQRPPATESENGHS